MAKLPPPQQPQLPPLDMTTAVECSGCKNQTFESVYLIRSISPLVYPTPNGKPAIIPIEVMACNACGKPVDGMIPNEFKEKKEDTSIVSTPVPSISTSNLTIVK